MRMVKNREPEDADWTAARRRTEMKWWITLTPNDNVKNASTSVADPKPVSLL